MIWTRNRIILVVALAVLALMFIWWAAAPRVTTVPARTVSQDGYLVANDLRATTTPNVSPSRLNPNLDRTPTTPGASGGVLMEDNKRAPSQRNVGVAQPDGDGRLPPPVGNNINNTDRRILNDPNRR